MRNFYEPIDMKDNEIENVLKVTLAQDASGNNEVVPKSQAETISALAVQAKIVASAGLASADTFFSSQYINTALANKQPNIIVDPSSTAYLEIVDGYKIKLKDLGIISNYKDSSNSTLVDFIADSTFNGDGTITIGGQTLDAMTFIFLDTATNPNEKSFIYLGTNNGTSDDFVSFSIDYNVAEIRSFFSATGTGLNYDLATGIYSISFGNGPGQMGGHTIPVDSAEFNVVNGSTVLAILKALETYIATVESNASGGATTVNDRLTSLSGVSGSDLLTFSNSLFPSSSSIKTVLQSSENLHKASIDDRALIRTEIAGEVNTLNQSIANEATARAGGDASLQNNINIEETSRINADNVLQTNINTEATNRISGDNTINGRLDIIEGPNTVAGSIAKAQEDAQVFATNAVSAEQTRALTAEDALNQKIDNLAEGDITFVGLISSAGIVSIRQARIDAGDTRNGAPFSALDISAGETFVAEADVTITFGDLSTMVLQTGDKIMAIDDVATGTNVTHFNVVQADGSAITVANIDDVRIELNGGNLDIVDGSIGNTQISATLQSDINDKRSLTSNNAITSDSDTHIVSSTSLGDQQNVFIKRFQTNSLPLTGTPRAISTELVVNSNGSTDALNPNGAEALRVLTSYDGACTDLSMVVEGACIEAAGKSGTATQATGIHARSISPHNGINVGATMTALGGGISNIGIVSLATDSGAGTERGIISAVSNFDIHTYSAARTSDPFPYDHIGLAADAKYAPAGAIALYAYGDVVFEGGTVSFPSAVNDDSPFTLGDVKNSQIIFETDLTNNVWKDVNVPVTFDLNKSIVQAIDDGNNTEIQMERDSANSRIRLRAKGGSPTGVRILIQELNSDVTIIP